MKIILLTLICAVLASCSAKQSSKNEVSASKNSSTIIGGTKVKEHSLISSSIVGIYDTENEFTCTGTLLENNVVLTAAHCIETKASKIRIVFGTELMGTLMARELDIQAEFVRRGTDAIVHPEYSDKENELKNTDWHDLALIKFAGTVPEGYKPATFLTDLSLLKKQAIVTLAGYGVTNVDVEDVDTKKYKNLEHAIATGEVVCDDEKNTHCYKLDFQGDDELYETTAPIDAITETEVRLDESAGHGTCIGDSGGPAYIQKDGVNYFFGITSRGSFACDGTGVYTNAVYFKNWIDENAKKLK